MNTHLEILSLRDMANMISCIFPFVQENQEYMFLSLDVGSLFTNVHLSKTVNIIFMQVYNKKLIPYKVLSTYQVQNVITFSFNNLSTINFSHSVIMLASVGPSDSIIHAHSIYLLMQFVIER